MGILFWYLVACVIIGFLSVFGMLSCTLWAMYMDSKGWRIYKDEEGNLIRRIVKK